MTEATTLAELAERYPETDAFLAQRFGRAPTPAEKQMGLGHWADKHGLPPARIVFMELQLASRLSRIRSLAPRDAARLLAETPGVRVLDVRESWERRAGSLPRSFPLDPARLEEILGHWPKETPILLYCHFGIRSVDAAAYLAQQGFIEIYTLQGGVDAWSQEIDGSIPRYTGSWC